MPVFDLVLSATNAVLSVLIVAGLVRRGRVTACAFLPAYLLAGLAIRVGRWAWQPLFYNWREHILTDLLQVALGVAIAIELVGRAFGSLPGGLARARRLQLLVAALALLALSLPWPELGGKPWEYVYGTELVQRLAYTRAWLFAAALAVATWYGVPLDRIHRDVAAGFIVWSLMMALGQQLGQLDGALNLCRQVVASLVYPGVLAAWTLMAWAPDERTRMAPSVLAMLRPWRASTP